MGTWKITVEGHGIHHNNRADDANEMARGFGNALLRNGHGLKEVQFQLTNSDGTPCAPVETIALDAQPSTEAPEHIMQFFAFAHLPPAPPEGKRAVRRAREGRGRNDAEEPRAHRRASKAARGQGRCRPRAPREVMTSPAIPWSVLRGALERHAREALPAIAAELRVLGYAIGPLRDDIDRALEAAAHNDPDELTRRLTPSRFDQQAAAVKRPSGTMAAIRDTDPAPPRESER
jgi:hypothetical protein